MNTLDWWERYWDWERRRAPIPFRRWGWHRRTWLYSLRGKA